MGWGELWMGYAGPFVFVFDELLSADENLRGQARTVRGGAGGLNISVGGLPPEARSIVAGLKRLGRRMEDAAAELVAAAADLGQTGAAAKRADRSEALAYAKALLLLVTGEAPEAVLRHVGTSQIAKLRRANRRDFRMLSSLEHRRDLARRAGNTTLVKQLDRQIESQQRRLRESSHHLRRAKQELQALRAAGRLPGMGGRTLRALRHVSGALGVKLPGTVMSVREWQRAVRETGSLKNAWAKRAMDRATRADDFADAARRLGARRAAGALPIAGTAADLAALGLDSKRFWDDPTLGNGVTVAADLGYAVGNIPIPPVVLIGNGIGVGLDGVKLLGDHADEIVAGIGDGVGEAADTLGDAAGEAKDFVEDKVPFL